jgi:anionic cell wall polymer biosynthesis LytR-Cps2A-Psr (LCP) family protein
MDTVEVDFNKLVAMVDEFEGIDVVVSNGVKVMVLLISLLENY